MLAALAALAAFLGLRQVVREGTSARLTERDLRIVHTLKARLESRFDAALRRIEGAELLVAATPPSARTAARALGFVLGEDSGEVPHAAAVVLDERGGIIASRRRGGIPSAGAEERNVWSQAVAALRGGGEAPTGAFRLEAGLLEGVAALLLAAPSPSTKGFWGVILPAEALLAIGPEELAPRESVFLLSEPDQNVLFARRGGAFLHEAVGRTFDKSLSLMLGILACCDPAAFNTVHEGDRFMVQLELSAGTHKLRLVRVADRRPFAADEGRMLAYAGGSVFLGWAILVGAFGVLRRGGGFPLARPFPRGRDRERLSDADVLSVLYRASEAVARGDHFREVILLTTQEAARHIGADRAFAALYDGEMGQLFEVFSSRLGDNYRAAIALGKSDLPEWIAIREGEVVEVTSVEEWAEAPEAIRAEGARAVAVFPMRAGERTLGLMSFYFDKPRELEVAELDFCTVLALQGAAAVARALSLAEPPPES